VGDGRARPQADRHAALDQLGGRFGGEALLVVKAHVIATLFGYSQRLRLGWNTVRSGALKTRPGAKSLR
jgi:hypothetical protein